MTQQRQHAAPGLYCPFWRKDVSKVCHTCAMWVPVSGQHPMTGERIDQWMCAITAQFLATVSVARNTNETCASVQEMRSDHQTERATQARLLGLRPAAQPAALPAPTDSDTASR